MHENADSPTTNGTTTNANANAAVNAGLWRAIVEGQYSIVESRSHLPDGRVARLLALRRNDDPAVRLKLALTMRERRLVSFMCRGYSGKAIAIEIGMSEATVSGALRTAAIKLGARSRLDLIRLLSTVARQNQQILRDAVAMTVNAMDEAA